MFEYHGWVTIRETPGTDDNEDLLRHQVEQIRECLSELGEHGLLDLRWINGTPFLHMGGAPNHHGYHGSQIIDLLSRVGQIAPGSYGLLYVWDDESAHHANEFRVFRLVRGKVSEHADTWLSPPIPALEDPYQV